MIDAEAYIRAHRDEPVAAVALALSKQGEPAAPYILRQIEGWQTLRQKVPTWAAVEGLKYPPRLSLEQCSGEAAARYKAAVAARVAPKRDSFADLTGGLGVDFSFIAPLFARSVYVEKRTELVELARHNLPLLGCKNSGFIEKNGIFFLENSDGFDLVFLDPARRSESGRKVFRLADSEPDVEALVPELKNKAAAALIKLSPMLDLTDALRRLPASEAHVVSVGGECKELLLVLTGARTQHIYCVEDGRVVFDYDAASPEPPLAIASAPQAFLYEPAPSLMKAGCFSRLASKFAAAALHPNSHLLTSDALLTNFPGRRFKVERVCGFGKRDVRELQRAGRANIAVRNFPLSAAEVRKRLKVSDGGDAYWFATTLSDGSRRVVCCKKV